MDILAGLYAMNRYKRVPALSLLTISIISSYASADELNFDFLQGTTVIPSVLRSDSAYPQGQYQVDVIVNKEKTGRVPLTVSAEEEQNNTLCLSPEWLKEAGVLFNPSVYADVFDKNAGCYRLSDKKPTQVAFNYGSQSLSMSIPQAYLLAKTDPSRWDYGVNGARLQYYANFNKSSGGNLNAFGNTRLGMNIGRWVLSGNLNASRNNNSTEVTSNDLTLSTAVSQIQGDVLLGKSTTRTELFNDFGFYGAALRSNSNMRPWDSRGYAPEISGVASSPSRITVKQNGYTIYSTVVPAGPYRLNDLRPTGNGDLVVSVEDERGQVTETTYPVSTLPTLLRPGEFRYNVAVGRRNTTDKLEKAFSSGDGIFGLGSFDYGFNGTTLNTAALVHNKYQAAGVGVTQTLGDFGAMFFNANTARAHYDDGTDLSGNSFSVKFAKNFNTRTDLQLLTYRYQDRGYVEFSEFDATQTPQVWRQKSRHEARLSHHFDNAYMSASYWQQDYWNISGKTAGANVSASTTGWGGTSLSLYGNWSQNPYGGKDDYSVSLGISVPFTLGSQQYYSNSSVGYGRSSGTSFNAGASATVNNRFYYSANTNADSRGSRGVSASASYAFDAVQTNMNVSQTRGRSGSADTTSVSGGFSGSVIATARTGMLFSKEASETVGIVSVPGVEGITFNNSMPTDRNGNTVVWLSDYAENSISVNMDNVPDNLDLKTTSVTVVPTEKAIVYREFGAEHVKRYVLQVRDRAGNLLTGGDATTEQGVNAGFITNNGVLLMNLLAAPESVRVSLDNGRQCRIATGNLKPDNNKVQEVVCE